MSSSQNVVSAFSKQQSASTSNGSL